MTRAEEIRRQLAEAIVRGRLAPGVALEEVELARNFGVSRTPVREAIRQLEAEGLALARPRRGAVVASITPEQLSEMFFVMGELEAITAQLAAGAMSEAERAALDTIHEESRQAAEAEDLGAYLAGNERFHDALYAGSHNGYLAELTRTVRRRAAPFRHAQFYGPGRLRRSYQEHDRVVCAIRARDGETAAREMRSHIVTVHHAVDAVKSVDQAAE